MRGGALPLLAWALLLATLMTICAVWTGEAIQVGMLAFAVLAILLCAAGAVAAGGRRALARGAPERERERPEPVPDMSLGAAIAAVGLGALVFGLAFGHFFIYFGAGLMLIGAGRTAVEVRAQRASLRDYLTHPRAGDDGQRISEQRPLPERRVSEPRP